MTWFRTKMENSLSIGYAFLIIYTLIKNYVFWRRTQNLNTRRDYSLQMKNIWRKFTRVFIVKIFANKHIIFTFAESENGYRANNVRVPYYAKKKKEVGVPCGLDA